MVAGAVGAARVVGHALVTAATMAAPASASDVLTCVREAMEQRQPLRIVGCGQWLDGGRPVRATKQLSVGSLTGIVDYVPGDLTLTALAGTTLAEIARVTGAESQWLALDPHGSADGSIGATIATASSGPLAHGLGLPRDVVLGLEVVTGAGAVVRAGGKVVKNVAGFDLTRLFTGSWGTLGVITEVTVRLRAVPDVDETVVLDVDDRPEPLHVVLGRLRAGPVTPPALELVNAALAARLGIGERSSLLARFAGNAQDVRAQQAWLAQLGGLRACPASVWRALRECEPPRSMVFRLSAAPARLADVWSAARAVCAAEPGTYMHATVGRGIVRCIVSPGSGAAQAAVVGAAASVDLPSVFERLPAQEWSAIGTGITHRLARGVKQTFDPLGIMNPGILGESA
ncbi:MAG TPA: FAD-binding oxidoreductase [Gemmatimonadaceae bacterium]|nr:FAD-binding oxidoreductase [Gemmatimonadaceae bacterium]